MNTVVTLKEYQFTDEELAACAERELKIRRRVYPGRVMTGRMNQLQADREIALMRQIAIDYRRKCELLPGPWAGPPDAA